MLLKTVKSLLYSFLILAASLVFAESGQKNEIRSALNYLSTYPNFDRSLHRYGLSMEIYLWQFSGENAEEREWFIFKVKADKLYKAGQKFPALVVLTDKIPRIIHQIWIGSPVPERYRDIMATWQDWTGWTYKLWTDEEVGKLQLQNQTLYDRAENYGEKADILRYELLYLYGGLYVDTDFICLDAGFFNFAHQRYSFYLGIEPVEHAPMSCCNALMAAAPKHPMMKKILDNLKGNIRKYPNDSAVERTGPRYISKVISSNLSLLQDGILFPPTFFYPIYSFEVGLFLRNMSQYIHPETVAIHLWDGSWREENELIEKQDFLNLTQTNPKK